MTPPEHLTFLTPNTLPTIPGFSQIVKVTGGTIIYLSGQVALNTSGQLVGQGDFAAQAEQVFENLRAALAAAGADFSHVVKLNTYLLDRVNLPVLRDVRDRFVNTQTPPASTLVLVSGLAQPDFLLEIEAIASLSS
ncbi:MAG TPA: RidA family protein [Ktedonobacterales bacterium]